jgi:hypothetical protein
MNGFILGKAKREQSERANQHLASEKADFKKTDVRFAFKGKNQNKNI